MGNILEAKQVRKVFGEGNEEQTTVLNGVDLTIGTGEFVAVMGQSGSGKSTLLYTISGMDHMTSGNVMFDGEEVSNLSEEKMSAMRLHEMGFVFQHSYLLKNMCIEDNILLSAYKAGIESKQIIKQRGKELMTSLGIDHVANHDITKVSGGQLQRAAICRALINNPKIIFADEPTGALNSSSTLAVMDIMNAINKKGTSIMLVTHDAKVAARADRVVFLTDGRVEAECRLGKYSGLSEELPKREELMMEFLRKRGF